MATTIPKPLLETVGSSVMLVTAFRLAIPLLVLDANISALAAKVPVPEELDAVTTAAVAVTIPVPEILVLLLVI